MIWTKEAEKEGFEYREPEKPQEFEEVWSREQTAGLCYITDIRHAIGNSDQYPYPLWPEDREHLQAQEAQEETLCAVIAAVNRVPLYEDKLDRDCISRAALLEHIRERRRKWGGEYDAEQILGDIENFEIRRAPVRPQGGADKVRQMEE